MSDLFSVYLLDENGQGSYLSVRDVCVWKTKRTAEKHAADIMCAIGKGGPFADIVEVTIENQRGDTLKTIWRLPA